MPADSGRGSRPGLAERGADPEEFEQVLEDVLIQPTFTAHPTEARRKTVKAKLRSVARHRTTRRAATHRTRTEAHRAEPRRRGDEPLADATGPGPPPGGHRRSANVQWYLENVLFDVIDEVYDELEHTLEDVYDEDIDIDTLYEFRSWAGSDRDGNPFVTTDVTEETLERQRETVAAVPHQAQGLSGVLSQDASNIATDALLNERGPSQHLPVVAEEADERYPNEPYRQKLKLMRERLRRVEDVRQRLRRASELLADLGVIADSLREPDAEVIAEAHVDPLIRRSRRSASPSPASTCATTGDAYRRHRRSCRPARHRLRVDGRGRARRVPDRGHPPG